MKSESESKSVLTTLRETLLGSIHFNFLFRLKIVKVFTFIIDFIKVVIKNEIKS